MKYKATLTVMFLAQFILILLFQLGNAQLELELVQEGASTLWCRKADRNVLGSSDVTSVTWTKDSTTYHPDGNRVVYQAGRSKLHFNSTILEDEGRWSCNIGDVTSQTLEYYVRPEVSGPVHVKHELFDSFFVSCNIELGPLSSQADYTVLWSRRVIRDDPHSVEEVSRPLPRYRASEHRQDMMISSSDGSHMFYASNFTLQVNSFNVVLQPESVGFVEYNCSVEVGNGYYTGVTTVVIQLVPPEILPPGLPHVVVGHPNRSVDFQVSIKSFPQPNIVWQHNNTTLQAPVTHSKYNLSNERNMTEKVSVSTLTVYNLSVEDSSCVSVQASMCNHSSSSDTHLLILAPVESVTITCYADQSTTHLTFTLPSNFPSVATDMPGLTAQLRLKFTLMSERQPRPVYYRYLTLSRSYLGPANPLLLETERDIPEEVRKAVRGGARFRVQAKIVLNGESLDEWSPPCSSGVLQSQCGDLGKIDITLSLKLPPKKCAYLQKKVEKLTKQIRKFFRERLLDCAELFLSDPVLNCFDNGSAVFKATLTSYGARVLVQTLGDALISEKNKTITVDGESVVIEEVVDAKPNSKEAPTFIICLSVIGALVIVVVVLVVVVIVVVVIATRALRKRKGKNFQQPENGHPVFPKDPTGDTTGQNQPNMTTVVQTNPSSASCTIQQSGRYIALGPLSRPPATGTQTALINSPNAADPPHPPQCPPGKGMTSRPSETSNRTTTTELSTTSDLEQATRSTSNVRDLREQCTNEGDYVTLANIQSQHKHRKRHSSDSRIHPQKIATPSLLQVTPAAPGSPSVRPLQTRPNNLPLMYYGGSHTPGRSQNSQSPSTYSTHRRAISDPSPMSGQIREQLWVMNSEYTMSYTDPDPSNNP